ncbi:MAG: VOC family protein [Betaproteobacteria bacterium]|nr:MAG: VOC family protein [Betaproteobacteria bacterium]
MFDHIGIGVSDLRASKRFYLEALAPLGVGMVMEVSDAAGLGQGRKPSFWLGASEAKPQPLHIAFAADTRAQVDEFYRKALAAGGKDNGPPGIRAHYHADYYAAFVIGPDGHNIEVVCHRPAG